MNQTQYSRFYCRPSIDRIVVDDEISLNLSSMEAWSDPESLINTLEINDELLLVETMPLL